MIAGAIVIPLLLFVVPIVLIERLDRPGLCPSCGQRGVRSRTKFHSAKYSIAEEWCRLCGYERTVVG